MARLARIVVAGVAHHVTQRGNRRQQVFFVDEDYAAYRALIAAENSGDTILISARWRINFREGWRGYLWQGRFASVAMDEAHLMTCARYVELNPVRAGLVARAADWTWSSAAAHLAGIGDALVMVAPMRERVDDWAAFLAQGLKDETRESIRHGERTDRPLGSKPIASMSSETGPRSLSQSADYSSSK